MWAVRFFRYPGGETPELNQPKNAEGMAGNHRICGWFSCNTCLGNTSWDCCKPSGNLGFINPWLIIKMGKVSPFSGNPSLLEGTPAPLIGRGLFIRGQHWWP